MQTHTAQTPPPRPFVPHPADEVMFASRLRAYDQLFERLALVPLGNRTILDAGCGNGKFLDICCRRWGAVETHCIGTDKRADVWEAWHAAHPETGIRFVQQHSEDMDFLPDSFDIVHQSMLLSSVTDEWLRTATTTAMWRALRPGGFLISYDFWLNPTNHRASGIRASTLRQLFPEGRLRYLKSLTLAPPLCRPLHVLGTPPLLALESLRVLNTHLLVALEKPGGAAA